MVEKSLIFRGKKIRKILHKGEWFFSVIDVIHVLTDSVNPRNYWNMLKSRELKNKVELYTYCVQLKLKSMDGKSYLTDCANKKGIFRIIQSIPSKKAEPFKLWLAKVGSDRIEEIENPELAQNRAEEYYKNKGYPKEWIEKRIRGIAIRQDLTNEWKERGIKENKEFAILTDEISKATFGISIFNHKKIKKLNPLIKNENLRDNMTDLELIFSMLGEKVTTEITKQENKEGFDECLDASLRGGNVAGNARKETEKEIGKKVVSNKNYLDISKNQKRLKIK